MTSIPITLEKWVCHATALTRREARAAIASGRVRVVAEGRAAEPTPERLIFDGDAVSLDGAGLTPRTTHVAALLHKPVGVTSSSRDTHGRDDLSRFAAAMPSGCRPVGRLDRESSGALLFTSDGDLANALLRPQHRTPKVYELRVDGPITEDDPRLRAMRAGVDSPVGHLTVAALDVAAQHPSPGPHRPPETTLRAVLTSGKNRHLRRMCYAAGLRLRALHRVRIGPIALGSLAPGAWRRLEDDELEALWEATASRAHVRDLQREALVALARAAREAGTPHRRLERWLAGDGLRA